MNAFLNPQMTSTFTLFCLLRSFTLDIQWCSAYYTILPMLLPCRYRPFDSHKLKYWEKIFEKRWLKWSQIWNSETHKVGPSSIQYFLLFFRVNAYPVCYKWLPECWRIERHSIVFHCDMQWMVLKGSYMAATTTDTAIKSDRSFSTPAHIVAMLKCIARCHDIQLVASCFHTTGSEFAATATSTEFYGKWRTKLIAICLRHKTERRVIPHLMAIRSTPFLKIFNSRAEEKEMNCWLFSHFYYYSSLEFLCVLCGGTSIFV